MSKYLVRPHDFHIWDLDESNGCYRSYSTRTVTYDDGTRPTAQPNHTFELLTNIYDFFPIEEGELEYYEVKHDDYMGFMSWQHRSDGHGGCKGGTREEYERYLIRVEEYQKLKSEQPDNIIIE